jgi:peroxiredoxin
MNYILVLLNQDIVNKYGRDLRFIPVTLLIDQQGNIAQKYVGFKTSAVLEQDIKKILKNSKSK